MRELRVRFLGWHMKISSRALTARWALRLYPATRAFFRAERSAGVHERHFASAARTRARLRMAAACCAFLREGAARGGVTAGGDEPTTAAELVPPSLVRASV